MCFECWSLYYFLWLACFFLPDLKTIVFLLLLECYLLCYKKRERCQLGYPHVLFTTLLQDLFFCNSLDPLLWIPIWKINIFSLIFCPYVQSVKRFWVVQHYIELRTVPPFSKFSGYLCKCCNIAVNELRWNYWSVEMLKKTGADDEWHSTAGGAIQKWALKSSWFLGPSQPNHPHQAKDQEILEYKLVVQMISFCAEWMEM